MATYTITLYDILIDYIMDNTEFTREEIKLKGTEWICENGRQYIFNFEYPIFDETYRSGLEKRFLMQYYVYEIGSDTYNLFKHRLITQLNLKMPYYNQLYKSSQLEFDALNDFDTTETHTRDAVNERSGLSKGNNSSTTTTDNQSIYSDTPQGLLSGKDYATNVTKGNNGVTATTTNEGTSSEDAKVNENITILKSGNMVDKSTLLQRYRNTFINIDMMLFMDLSDLFMLIY